jgi:hypothetical protein
MDQPADSMAGVGGQEDITTVDLMASSSLMEDSRALEIHAVGGGRREDEQQITQVTSLFRSLCLFFHVVCFLTYSAHISQNTMSVTIGVKMHTKKIHVQFRTATGSISDSEPAR